MQQFSKQILNFTGGVNSAFSFVLESFVIQWNVGQEELHLSLVPALALVLPFAKCLASMASKSLDVPDVSIKYKK